MGAKLVRCSAASKVMSLVVMTESFTYASACEPVDAASSAANATVHPSNMLRSKEVIATFVFTSFPHFETGADRPTRLRAGRFAAVPTQRASALLSLPQMPHFSEGLLQLGLINECPPKLEYRSPEVGLILSALRNSSAAWETRPTQMRTT